MSLSKLEKLMYSIGVVDKASAPVNKIMGKIQQMNQMASNAQDQMMRGFMGAAGGAMLLAGSLTPAIAANQSLGEVESLGVAESSLMQLNNTALNFTSNFGGNTSEVISSAYDIQSSIAGLTGQELSDFTQASAIMAKGVKSDAGTATNYLGTMYGIYQNDASAMGKSNWVEQLAGQTATAVRMFKTNGNEMSSAFGSLGANAQSHGIDMAESMAVLGQLQSTMSGSEAGTKYKAFLSGVGNAQEKLGMQLTDTHGKLLPMPQVLERLQTRFGDIDTVAKSDALKKAFGSEEAVGLIKLLMPQVNQLKGNITELNNQTGMETALEMANAQTDAWQRLSGSFNAVATSLGQKLLPFVEPVVDVFASILQGILWLTDEFPVLTGIISTVVIGVTSLVVGMGAFNMIVGLTKFGLIGLTGASASYNAILAVMRKGLLFSRGALMSFMLAQQLAGGTMALFRTTMLSGIATTWAFNAALLANPITWIIGGIVLLSAMVYKYWQPIKAFMSGFWNGFKEGFAPVMDVFTELASSLSWVGDLFGWIANKVSGLFSWFGQLLAPVNQTTEQLANATNAGVSFGQTIGSVFNLLLSPLKLFIKTFTAIVDLISSASDLIKSFFGFGDDVKLEAKQKLEHEIANKLPTNSVDNLPQAANANVGGTISTTSAIAANNATINSNTAINTNTASSFTNQGSSQALPSNVVQLSQYTERNQANTKQVANQVSSNASSNNVLALHNAEKVTSTTNKQQLNSKTEQSKHFASLVNTHQLAGDVTQLSQNTKQEQLNSKTEQSKHFASLVNTHQLAGDVTQLTQKNSQTNQKASTAQIETFELQQSKASETLKPEQKKIQKSVFAQQIANSSSNNSSSNSDQSKHVHIDSLVMKSDNVEQDFENLMELAG